MKTIFVLMQPAAQNAYWSENITAGIADAALRYGDTLQYIDVRLPYRFRNAPVLIVGNEYGWLEKNIKILIKYGAQPIIVNASMPQIHGLRCSGVFFELEEMIQNCVSYLHISGRRNIVMLGVNPDSATDKVKCDAFASPENIVYAEGKLVDCVESFVSRLETSGCDAALCANDTVAVCLEKRLLELGYKLPNQFYIIGMGNSYIGTQLRIPLTSVMFNYREMGEQAVRLLHDVRRNPLPCHVSVSLPCRLIIRESTCCSPTDGVCADTEQSDRAADEVPLYFAGSEAQSIIRTEALLQSCGDTDREIIFSLMKNCTCESIAERTFLSERAVRYRISNLVKHFGCETRSDLCHALRNVMGVENDDKI